MLKERRDEFRAGYRQWRQGGSKGAHGETSGMTHTSGITRLRPADAATCGRAIAPGLRSPKMESLRCMDHMDGHMAHLEKRPASRDGCGWLQTAVQTTCLALLVAQSQYVIVYGLRAPVLEGLVGKLHHGPIPEHAAQPEAGSFFYRKRAAAG